MSEKYFKYDVELNVALTLLIDDIFTKIQKDFPNSDSQTLFTTSDSIDDNEKAIPVVIYISHKDINNKQADMYLNFSKTTPESSNSGNRPPYLYTTNKDRKNSFGEIINLIHTDDYKKELLEAFPDINQFKNIEYIRKGSDTKKYQPELELAKKLFMETKLQYELSNKEVVKSKKSKI